MPRTERKEYLRTFNRQWRLKRVVRMHELLGGKCAVCGAVAPLEVHHKDPAQKSFDPKSQLYAWSRALEELKKCELLCDVCHQDKHGRAQHGSRGMYVRHKCRCELCVQANSAYMRPYQASDKQLAYHREWRKKPKAGSHAR